MKYFNRMLHSLESQLLSLPTSALSFRLFRAGTYGILLMKMLLLWPELETFYQHVLSQGPNKNFEISKIIFSPTLQNHPNTMWGIACAIILFAVVAKNRRWLAVLVFVIGLNYMALAHFATNTGDAILNFFIFCLMFIKDDFKQNFTNQLMSKATLLILQVNVCFIYFINGYGKILRETWRDGSIMNSVWQIAYYANSSVIPGSFFNANVGFFMAWSVILFELSFSVLIWFKSTRKWLVPLGLLFHIFIGIFLSIPDFSLTMMVAYLLFVDMDKGIRSLKKNGIKKSDFNPETASLN